MPLIIPIIILVLAYLALRLGFIVFDRNVFGFQVNPILKKGKISNLREYKVVQEFVEMNFEHDPDSLKNNPKCQLANELLANFDS